MAFYQILYWQEIPSQIKVWDDFDEIKVELSAKFMAKIDNAARQQDLTDESSYLSQWNWGEAQERSGTVEEVCEAVKQELEENFKK
jgi:Virulence factor